MKTRLIRLVTVGFILGVSASLRAEPGRPAPGPGAWLASGWQVRPTEHLVMAGGAALLGLALWRRARHPHS